MGAKYSSNSTSGYNATPPADDGTVSEANKGKWSTIKEKLSDPVKTLADAINTDLVEHFDNGPVAYTSNQTIGASHYGKVIQVSGAANTQTLSDAATLGAGWNCEFVSTDTTNTVTIARATASDMINETTANISLLPLQSIKAVVNAAANGFLVGFVTRKDKANTISESNTYSGANTFSGNNTWTGQNVGLFSTGDVKLTLKTAADSGWVLMNDGTIGNASSGGTSRANADSESLFTLLWTNTLDAWCAVSTGRGASAAADFAANKTIALPKALGRALAVYGAGSGLTTRALAQYLGAETHQLTAAEMPSHTHTQTVGGNAVAHTAGAVSSSGTDDTTTGSAGSDGAHNNMQPSLFLNVMVKL